MNKRTQKTVVVKKRVLIVDDHPALRAGLRCYIELQPDWLVCGEAASAAEALTAVEQQHPDLAVIDLSLKDSHGLDLIKNLHVLHPDLLLLAFSMHPERDYAERILRAAGMVIWISRTAHSIFWMRFGAFWPGTLFQSVLEPATAATNPHCRCAARPPTQSDSERPRTAGLQIGRPWFEHKGNRRLLTDQPQDRGRIPAADPK